MLRIDVDGALVELRSLPRIVQFLIDHAHVETCVGVLGRDLQDVLEFDARLFEIAVGQIGLSLPFCKCLALRASAPPQPVADNTVKDSKPMKTGVSGARDSMAIFQDEIWTLSLRISDDVRMTNVGITAMDGR